MSEKKSSDAVNGIALIAALCMLVFLFILAVALLTSAVNELHLVSLERADMAAFYLAEAGKAYYLSRGVPEAPVDVPPGNSNQFFTIAQDPVTGNLTFSGIITDGRGKIIAKRQIISPAGSL